jgi:uncharacterized protein (UPF0332 family)
VSPRSAEFMVAARRRLATAASAVTSDPSTAISVAYYAMLYAARAALSERDTYAKTHAGTWHQLRVTFVEAGVMDAELVAAVQRVQARRERADYEAWAAPEEQAQQVIELATRFLAAIEAVIGPPPDPA